MSRVIAVANQKGGIGKTTTAVNIAFDLAEMGKKVLLIDTDGQCNSTDTCRAQVEGVATLYDLLFENERASDCIQHMEKLDVIASDKLLKNPETKFPDDATRLFTLCDACEEIREQYDFIIIDCPPSLGLLTLNAFTAADSVLIPIQSEFYALEGVSQLVKTITIVQQTSNKNLEIEGVLLTMFDGRTNLSIQVADEVKKFFGNKVYKTIIPRNVRLSEAPSYGEPIIVYDPKSKGADVYTKLAKEVIKASKDK